MANKEFYAGKKPPVQFTMNVIATDLELNDPNFKIKIVIDFVPQFTLEQKSDNPNFHGNRVHKLLNFISNRVIKKVIEYVYYDRSNPTFVTTQKLALPTDFNEAIVIYNQRQQLKKAKGNKGLSYLDHREEKANTKAGEKCIEEIVDSFFYAKNRAVWSQEKNVTRITYEHLSPPSLKVETQAIVNGDKRPR